MAGDLNNSAVYSETDSSNNTATDPGWPEGMAPSRVNDAARALQGALKRDWDRRGPTLTAGGTATAITLTYSVAPTAYVQGDCYSFIVGAVNTGAATLNVNALGAKNITKNGTTALQGGELAAGSVASVMYDGTQFQLISNNMTEATATWGGTSGGSANAQTVTLTPVPGAYYAGMIVAFKAGFTNTSTATLNVNSLGAKNVFVANAACAGGEIVSGTIYEVVYDGTQFQMLSPQSTQHGGLIGFQSVTTSGTSTYTPTAGTNSVQVLCVGSGGAGGSVALTGGAQSALGGGGGAGAYAWKRVTTGFSGVTITVGAKGAKAAAGNNAGGNGNTSSFGAVCSAAGGSGGSGGAAGTSTAVTGASGGQSTTGDIGVPGGQGGNALAVTTAAVIRGGGGSSAYGTGASAAGSGTGITGSSGTGYGGGGSGAANAASQAAGLQGGDGADGAVFVWEYN